MEGWRGPHASMQTKNVPRVSAGRGNHIQGAAKKSQNTRSQPVSASPLSPGPIVPSKGRRSCHPSQPSPSAAHRHIAVGRSGSSKLPASPPRPATAHVPHRKHPPWKPRPHPPHPLTVARHREGGTRWGRRGAPREQRVISPPLFTVHPPPTKRTR